MSLAGTSYFLPSLSRCLPQLQVPASKTTARYASIELEPTTQTYLPRWTRPRNCEVAISTQKENRHRGYIAATFRKLETTVSMLSILFIHITNAIRDLCRSFCTAFYKLSDDTEACQVAFEILISLDSVNNGLCGFAQYFWYFELNLYIYIYIYMDNVHFFALL